MMVPIIMDPQKVTASLKNPSPFENSEKGRSKKISVKTVRSLPKPSLVVHKKSTVDQTAQEFDRVVDIFCFVCVWFFSAFLCFRSWRFLHFLHNRSYTSIPQNLRSLSHGLAETLHRPPPHLLLSSGTLYRLPLRGHTRLEIHLNPQIHVKPPKSI